MIAGFKFFLATAVAVAVTRAQEAWLQPERFAATPGATLFVNLTGGDGSVGEETAIEPERVARAVARLGGAGLSWGAAPVNEGTLRYPVTVPRPGVGVLGVELTRRVREREPAEIEAYLRAIHAGGEGRESWAAEPEPRRWRETGVTHAKTFVRVGEPAGDERSWAEPLGLALEHAAKPQLRRLANVQHLDTPVRAVLPEAVRLLEVLAALHPTPAVGGSPRAAAVARIRELEGFPRGLYAGALGWLNARGGGEFFVGIRSALVDGANVRVYAGAGIVAGSAPEKEFAETELKFKAMLDAVLMP